MDKWLRNSILSVSSAEWGSLGAALTAFLLPLFTLACPPRTTCKVVPNPSLRDLVLPGPSDNLVALLIYPYCTVVISQVIFGS